MIRRDRHRGEVLGLLRQHPVVAILGARQVGKTTLARAVGDVWRGPVTRLDLEDADDLALLQEPKLALAPLRGLVVVDEVQRRPEIFPVLRVLADRPETPARFLLLGSASPDLLRQSSESLAGRIAFHRLEGFHLGEVGARSADRLWLRGGFPRSFLASDDAHSAEWRREFVQTFLERDLPQLGVKVPSATLHRFWRMLAHYHGQIWNGAELARAFGVAATTVRRYLDLLAGALVVRIVPPWHENLSRRQVKSPKVYVADTGLLHTLLGVATGEDLRSHPKVGASWEGFVLGEIARHLAAREEEIHFWAAHAGGELDMLVVRGNVRLGFEVKRTTSPQMRPGLASLRNDLALSEIYLVHAGDRTFPLAPGVTAVAFGALGERLPSLDRPRGG